MLNYAHWFWNTLVTGSSKSGKTTSYWNCSKVLKEIPPTHAQTPLFWLVSLANKQTEPWIRRRELKMVHIQLKMVTTSTTYNSRLSHIGDILKNLNVRESLIAVRCGQRDWVDGRPYYCLCVFSGSANHNSTLLFWL